MDSNQPQTSKQRAAFKQEIESASQESATVVTPVEIGVPRLTLRVDFFDSPIELSRLPGLFASAQVLYANPLVARLPCNSYVVVLHFGAVVFWHCAKDVCADVLTRISGLVGMRPPNKEVRDALPMLLGQPEDRVSFKEVCLKDLTLEHIRIVSQVLGQSASLKHCELSVARAIANVQPVVDDLKGRGKLPQSGTHILKMVGFTLDIRETILSKLTLFDDPVEAWSSERFSRLHSLLCEHFDIRNRLAALQPKLDFLADLNQTLMNLLQHRASHRLEWIVVILIVVEVIIALIEIFPRSH